MENYLHTRNFPPAKKETWRNLAQKELKGKDPFSALTFLHPGGITAQPYYDASDVSALPYLENFQNPLPHNHALPSRNWLNLGYVLVEEEKEGNRLALAHLQGGGDGLWLDLSLGLSPDFYSLLNQIHLAHCPVFMAQPQPSDIENFIAYLKIYYSGRDILNVRFFSSKIPNFPIPANTQPVFLHGLWVPALFDPVEELTQALALVVGYLSDKSGQEIFYFFSKSAFSFALGQDFFLEAAKIKAFRWLFHALAKAYGVELQGLTPDVHMRSSPWSKDSLEPQSSLLKGTTASLAAIVGGCDSLTVIPKESSDSEARLARNISLILKEESHLDKVSDPLAGSYYFQRLIDSLAHRAWEKFMRLYP